MAKNYFYWCYFGDLVNRVKGPNSQAAIYQKICKRFK